RASTGDNHLGGEDFNELLVSLMREAHAGDFGTAGRGDDALHQKLRQAAERARRTLSSAGEAEMRIVWNDAEYRHM
ncbi:Hsp70 family protein, partial [Mycobacterium tuberculosis]|nr:Hsp70 family protein [Mycobacterium tuberculosis]